MYYNDQPADMIMYQGLAYQKLGSTGKPKPASTVSSIMENSTLKDQVKIEYFAVSLPDFLIFDEDYTRKNKAHCCYLMALGNIGLGSLEKAHHFLGKPAAGPLPHDVPHL